MVWKSNKINQVYLLLYLTSQSELRIISESPENRLRVFSELSWVVIEWPQSLLTVISESPQIFLRAFSVLSQKLFQSYLRVVSEFLPLNWTLVFWYFWYFKLLQTIEWNLKERKWRIFCTFSKKYYESFQFWFTVWLVCASIPTHPSPFWLWIAAMIKSWLQTIYSSTTYWEIGFWMHNGIFCISL